MKHPKTQTKSFSKCLVK